MNQQKEKHDVFISYCRHDGDYAAKLVKEHLERWGLKVFVDLKVLSTEPDRFEKHIQAELKNSEDFLLLITPETFNKKKMNDYEDLVIKEIKCALDERLNFISVLTKQTMGLPNENVVPKGIRAFLNKSL